MEYAFFLGARGLDLKVKDGRLIVSPEVRITAECDQIIREHRDEIIAFLQDPDPWKARREHYGRIYRGTEAS